MTSRYFAAFFLRREADAAPSRFGFTTPRALGKAVVRNRLKRRVREAVKRHLSVLPVSWSVVLNPRRTALDAPFEDLCREVNRVFSQCARS